MIFKGRNHFLNKRHVTPYRANNPGRERVSSSIGKKRVPETPQGIFTDPLLFIFE
jgi:hypothetical protein